MGIKQQINKFLHFEAAGGIVLVIATLLALLFANTPLLSEAREFLLNIPIVLGVGMIKIDKSFIYWINDGLMAMFFFLVGLELKREMLEGALSKPSQVILPCIAAVGGILAPALIYSYINWGDSVAMQGWAIPTATDIAFAYGVLSLFGKRVPIELKVFLLTLAILDDLAAILIIALLYSHGVSLIALLWSVIIACALFILNRLKVDQKRWYFLLGFLLWVTVLKSGIHATIAGVLLAFFIPMYSFKNPKISHVKNLEHSLHKPVNFLVLPIFAFANAGLPLNNLTLDQVFHSVPVGIVLGLFIGKPLGIFSLAYLSIKLKIADIPKGTNFKDLFAVSLLCGIGFTMSLFIGSLAFKQTGVYPFDERLGILFGSLISGLCGYYVLNKSLAKK